MKAELPSRRISVAPMMDRTNRHFRFFMRRLAPHAWLYTEMIPVGALVNGDPERHLRFHADEHPVALQLGGSDPEQLALAADLGAAAGYDEINLNVGCPSARVQHACWGAALMLDAGRVAECVAAMIERVAIPVTVKTRLGVDAHDDYEFLTTFIETVARAGCNTFILHARKAWLSGLSPKQNRAVPPLDYDRVARVKQDMRELEIIVNGGITSAPAAQSLLSKVDGVMLGRAAWRQPMLIAELDALCYGTPAVSRLSALESYLPYLEQELAAGQSLQQLTRHLFGLFAGERNGALWRSKLVALGSGAEGLATLRKFVSRAREEGVVEPSSLAA
jgi:tRNA-dihydrouridine synthase A